MKNKDKTREELIKELHAFQQDYNSMKESLEKEIIELRQAKKTLAHEQYLMDVIMNNLPDHIYFKDRESRFIRINISYAVSLGLTNPDQAIGKTDFDFHSREHAQLAYNDEQTIIQTGQPLTKEEKLVHTDNPDLWVYATKLPFRNKEGKIVGTFGISRDITKRKLAEEALHESEERFRSLYENASIGMYRTTPDGRILMANPSLLRMLGFDSFNQLVQRNLNQEGYETDYPRSKFLEAIEKHGEVIGLDSAWHRQDGNTLFVRESARAIRDDQGQILYYDGTVEDITQRKLAEEALRESEEHYKILFTEALDGICLVDAETGLIIDCNQALSSLVGRERMELIGQSQKILHPQQKNKAAFSPTFEQHLNDKEGETLETQIITSKGIIREVEIKANRLNIHGRKTLQGVFRDITERKQAEEKLAHEQYLVRTLMDNLPDHIYFKDHASRFIRINKAQTQFLGLNDPNQAVGKTDFDFFTKEHAQQAYEDEQNIIRTGQLLNIEEKETHHNRPDTWVSTIKLPLRNKAGKIIGTFGISRDITERKRRELESQILYEITQGVTTTDNLDELLKMIHHSLGKVVYAENCFIALYDQETGLFSFPYFVDKFDSVYKPTTMQKSCTAYVFRTVKPLVLTQQSFDYLVEQNEVELVGSNAPSWIGIPLQTPTRTIGVLVLQHYEKDNVYSESDVQLLISIGSQIAISIERKKAEEEIKFRNKQLLEINAEKDKFFSIIAHDLKGPLSSFLGATQILTEEIQTMTLEEIKEITGSMKESASNIYRLLENLLEWSRLKRGMMDFNPEKINVKQKIISSVEVLIGLARKKEIKINSSLPEDLTIYADSHMFETIVRNLVSNAIKFTPKSGEISVSATATPDNTVEIKIRDTGIGMAKELINKLFLLNEKTNRKGTEGEPSTGLGLLLCKEFIEKNNGKIRVESEEGKGSTFSFTIPEKV